MESKTLPNSIREYLLQRHENCVRIWDLLLALDLQTFSVQDVLFKCWDVFDMSEWAIREGLKSLKRLGVLAVKIVRQKVGRPVQFFRLSPVKLILERWNLREGAVDAVEVQSLRRMKTYRAALHRGFIKRLSPTWTRKNLGARLGVSGRATYNYERLYDDIVVIERTEQIEITLENNYSPFERWCGDLPDIVAKHRSTWLEVYEDVLYTDAENLAYNENQPDPTKRRSKGATKTMKRRYKYLRIIAERLLKRGARVYAVRRLTNQYRVLEGEELEYWKEHHKIPIGGEYWRWFE